MLGWVPFQYKNWYRAGHIHQDMGWIDLPKVEKPKRSSFSRSISVRKYRGLTGEGTQFTEITTANIMEKGYIVAAKAEV